MLKMFLISKIVLLYDDDDILGMLRVWYVVRMVLIIFLRRFKLKMIILGFFLLIFCVIYIGC